MLRSVKYAERLNLSQCLEIKSNQYRSKHNDFCYCPDSVDSRIIELLSNKAEREVYLLEQLADILG